MQACTAQTTTMATHDFDRYLVYYESRYVETAEGEFAFEDSVIEVDVQTDRTIYVPSFIDATVTVFADGSLDVLYGDGWNVSCPYDARYSYSCTMSDPDEVRSHPFVNLLAFRDVVIMPAEYYPLADYPVEAVMDPWQILVVIAFGLFMAYAALSIVSLPLHKIAYRSKPATKVGAMLNPTREGQDGKTYWIDAYAATQTITDERKDSYGKQPFDTNQDPASSLLDRFRDGWPLLAAGVVLFGVVLAAFLIF